MGMASMTQKDLYTGPNPHCTILTGTDLAMGKKSGAVPTLMILKTILRSKVVLTLTPYSPSWK